VNIGGYPVQELGGLVWGYLGPQPVPVLPPYDFLVWPNSIRQIGITNIPCNWLQCHENSADPYHNTYLHGHLFRYALERAGTVDERGGELTAHRSQASINGTIGADHIVFEHDEYGFRKGIMFSEERGAPVPGVQWHAYNIYPYFSRGAGGYRTQVNMRVPMDDTHTYHINYTLFHVPDIEAPSQASIPYFHAPMFDEEGNAILDYVLAQDMAAWWSQGAITDRSKEQLGATDLAIVEFRRIIEDQITAVEEGRDPINTFRDSEAIGECITLRPNIGAKLVTGTASGPGMESINKSRTLFHKGFSKDDADRYGPATPLAADLMRKAQEQETANS
jgi:5,5'-dehydrodivanillate O-demethylase